jgi:plastocyanin
MEDTKPTKNHHRKRHNAILPFLGFAITISVIGLTISVLSSSQAKNNPDSGQPITAETEQIAINIDNQGKFTPEVLAIDPGTKVIWQSADNEEMSVLVDSPNNNTSDQRIETVSSKVFNDQGSYNFWDPQNPKENGQIIVN